MSAKDAPREVHGGYAPQGDVPTDVAAPSKPGHAAVSARPIHRTAADYETHVARPEYERLVAERDAALEDARQLREAMCEAAIPLEGLHAAHWPDSMLLDPVTLGEIHNAVVAVRRALRGGVSESPAGSPADKRNGGESG